MGVGSLGCSLLTSVPSRRSPRKRQHGVLSEPFAQVRWLWNPVLAARKQAGEEWQETVD